MIKGHRLHQSVVNPIIPLRFLYVEDHDARKVSKAYQAWEQEDHLLLSRLQLSLLSAMLTHVVCTNSWDLWDKIHNYFHSHTRAKARQLRTELHFALFAIGDPVSAQEHLNVVREGLPE